MAKNTKALKGRAVRILRDLQMDGTAYKAGQVVAFSPALAEALQKDGSVDGHQDAVGYALAQGEQAVQHTVPDADEKQEPTPAPTPDPTPDPTPAPDSGAPNNDPE